MIDPMELGIGANEADAADLLDVERNRRQDETIRLWFIYTALNYANNNLSDVARANYNKALNAYLALYNHDASNVAMNALHDAIKERFKNEYAEETLTFF